MKYLCLNEKKKTIRNICHKFKLFATAIKRAKQELKQCVVVNSNLLCFVNDGR